MRHFFFFLFFFLFFLGFFDFFFFWFFFGRCVTRIVSFGMLLQLSEFVLRGLDAMVRNFIREIHATDGKRTKDQMYELRA